VQHNLIKRAGVAALVVASVVASPLTASAATSTVPYLCPTEVDGQPVVLNYQRDYDVIAPETVKPGEKFTITFDNAVINPRPEFQNEVYNIRIVYNLPESAAYVGHTLTGGSNLGDSKQSVEVSGNRITLIASGPLKAGEDHDLPNLNVELTAPESGKLVTSAAGTSYDDPGFRWSAKDPATGQEGHLQCYPDPAKPVELSKTEVQGTMDN
jgi:dehydratase